MRVGTSRRGTVNRGVKTPKLFMNDQRVREYNLKPSTKDTKASDANNISIQNNVKASDATTSDGEINIVASDANYTPNTNHQYIHHNNNSLPIYHSDSDSEDELLVPELNDVYAEYSTDDDDYINISTSIVSEIGNNNDIDITDIDYSLLDEQTLHEIQMMAVQMNRKSMEKLHPGKTKDSLTKELKAILDRKTFKGVHRDKIPSNQKINYMMSKHTVKNKDGIFDRVKSRTLIGGDRMKSIYKDRTGEISARTISLTALYTIATLVAYLELQLGSFDFQNAFVNATLPDNEQCFARMPKEESAIMVEIDPDNWEQFLDPDGHIYVRLLGALYGHPLAPMLWYQFMKDKLGILGFTPIECEPCIFIRINSKTHTLDIIGVHVDDLFIGTKCSDTWDEIRKFRDDHFRGEGTLKIGDKIEYCNIDFEINRLDKSVKITQESYWKKIIEKFQILPSDKRKTPFKSDYMERLRNRSDDVTETQTEFLSIIMSIFWGSKRSKPETLFTVSSLATQAKHGTQEDYTDAISIMQYINDNIPQGIRLTVNGKLRIHCFVDSSGSIHKDTKGHGGWVYGLGDNGYGGPIEAHSGKAKINARSILEYELLALHEALPSGLFLFNLLEELGFPQEPIMIFEDNFGLIELIKRGPISTGVTKHIATKYYGSRDLMGRNIICFRHCPTYLMIADILTKVLTQAEFINMAARLRNDYIQSDKLTDEVYAKLFANSNDRVYIDENEERAVKVLLIMLDSLNSQY